jgi:hypothetical protein
VSVNTCGFYPSDGLRKTPGRLYLRPERLGRAALGGSAAVARTRRPCFRRRVEPKDLPQRREICRSRASSAATYHHAAAAPDQTPQSLEVCRVLGSFAAACSGLRQRPEICRALPGSAATWRDSAATRTRMTRPPAVCRNMGPAAATQGRLPQRGELRHPVYESSCSLLERALSRDRAYLTRFGRTGSTSSAKPSGITAPPLLT